MAWSRNLFWSGSGCHVVGWRRFSIMKAATPDAAPCVAMFAITFWDWILRPSSSSVSMPTCLTMCAKSFSRLTNTCGDTLTSPWAGSMVCWVRRVLDVPRRPPRGGVAGRRASPLAGGRFAAPESLLPPAGALAGARSAVLPGAPFAPLFPPREPAMGSSIGTAESSSIAPWGAKDAAIALSKSRTCRSAVGAEGLLWSNPPYAKSSGPMPQQECRKRLTLATLRHSHVSVS
mmetsp:Transcript_114840/g.325268  ORF Transcript_114840/g.325268 Transcript_114840/m.325268 type:complete len:232 (-) Transcript_114840:57-752(-)